MAEKPFKRIVIPVLNDAGMNSQVSEHFGRAPYFAVVDINREGTVAKFQIVPNRSEHFGGFGKPPEKIMELNPDAVVTYGMGPRALSMFQSFRIAVLKTVASTVGEVVEAYKRNELEELTEGCREARHL